MKDRIGRLAASDLAVLIDDLRQMRTTDTRPIGGDRDDQVAFVSEQLNGVFQRAHLDGVRTLLEAMPSSVSRTLREFIERIDKSVAQKLTDNEQLLVESYAQDHLTFVVRVHVDRCRRTVFFVCLSSKNEQELKTVYERLTQQGTMKRRVHSGDLQQTIIMGLMNKIQTDGLSILIDHLHDAHMDIEPVNELEQTFTRLHRFMQSQATVPLEQLQNQLSSYP